MSATFTSAFAARLSDYVRLRRSLGLKFAAQAEILRGFDRHVKKMAFTGPLTEEIALGYAKSRPTWAPMRSAQIYQVVRHFAEYLSTFDPTLCPLDPRALVRPRERPPAHIYSDAEIAQLLELSRNISVQHPIRGVTLHAMVGLAASTGLRISEVVGLNRAHVDLKANVLEICQSKFRKDRLVPLHETTADLLRSYVRRRDAVYEKPSSPAFFLHLWGGRFSKQTLQMTFWDVTRRAGLRGDRGHGPSFHDLRHTFAVRRLIAWYEEGIDVQVKLPFLATYMGHAHYTDTAYYITAVPELMALASTRFEAARSHREAP